MRTLSAEPGQDGFDAEKLFSPPLVYVWIPMSLLTFICIFCAVRYALRRRKKGECNRLSTGPPINATITHGYVVLPHKHFIGRRAVYDQAFIPEFSVDRAATFLNVCCDMSAGSKNVQQKLYDPSDFRIAVDPVPFPNEEDRPQPRRTLARLSHHSAGGTSFAGNSAELATTSGGITHAQLQKLQLADIANLLLPDRTHSINSQSGVLPYFGGSPSGASTPVVQDAQPFEAKYVSGLNDIFHDTASPRRDLSARLDPGMRSPSGTKGGQSGCTTPLSDAASVHDDADVRHVFRTSGHAGKGHDSRAKQFKYGMPNLRSPSHKRSVSQGSDVLSRYTSACSTLAESSLYHSTKLYSQGQSVEIEQ